MTIKEIENRSGMTRANIRFYESEGLLAPTRSENGYRDYSEEDLAQLQKIRLLRALGVPLEELRLLQSGERELSDALFYREKQLEQEKAGTEHALDVCKELRDAGAEYATLDAPRWLDALEQTAPRLPAAPPQQDAIPKVRAPIRRYFARLLDQSLCFAACNVFYILVCNRNPLFWGFWENMLTTLMGLLMVLFLEPLFLCKFGSTPGKWLLGLSVTDSEDRRLSYLDALARTWSVLRYGLGFGIPIYNIVRLVKSYNACQRGETLDWEYDTSLALRRRAVWRYAVYVVAVAAVLGLFELAALYAGTPRHRGELTVAEFCENYNRLANWYGLGYPDYSLDAAGNWACRYESMYALGGPARPQYRFTEENGVMTGLEFEVENRSGADASLWVNSYTSQMELCMLAFAGAQPGAGLSAPEAREAMRTIAALAYQDYALSVYGVELACAVDYTNYTLYGYGLTPGQEGPYSYSIRFEMRK